METFNGLPIYEAYFRDDELLIEAIAFVQRPANKREFIALAETEPARYSIQDEERRIVTGLIMGVDQIIYRRDAKRGEYYVHFSREAVWNMMLGFMRNMCGDNVLPTHIGDNVEDVFMIESYLKDAGRGIAPVGYDDMPDGSWFGTWRVENDEVWQSIKDGTFKGFSIHGEYYVREAERNIFDSILDELDQIDNEISLL